MRKITVTVPTQELFKQLAKEVDQQRVQLLVWDLTTPPPQRELTLVVPPYLAAPKCLRALANTDTHLVQWQSIGYDGVAEYLPAGTLFANAAGVHESATAELALGLAISGRRNFTKYFTQQQEHTWAGARSNSLADSSVLLLGYGGVGKAIAARLEACEARVQVVTRSARNIVLPVSGNTQTTRTLDALPQLLPQTDVLMLAVPLTAATCGLIGARELAALPDGALVVNVARGPVLDTMALVEQLRAGRLRAALDVVEPEPLPPTHPLWRCPNLLITPHVGGNAQLMVGRIARLVQRQIQALQDETQLFNLVMP